tara:strand:+ start:3335 stop:3634 length:300 start_codon:yes stop_codon:yes gene_type:complete
MPTRGGRKRRTKKRRTKKSGRGVGGLKHHLPHLDRNKALINTLKSAAKGNVSVASLKKAQTGLKRMAVHARKAASAAGKGVTKLKRSMSGTRKRRRRRR